MAYNGNFGGDTLKHGNASDIANLSRKPSALPTAEKNISVRSDLIEVRADVSQLQDFEQSFTLAMDTVDRKNSFKTPLTQIGEQAKRIAQQYIAKHKSQSNLGYLGKIGSWYPMSPDLYEGIGYEPDLRKLTLYNNARDARGRFVAKNIEYGFTHRNGGKVKAYPHLRPALQHVAAQSQGVLTENLKNLAFSRSYNYNTVTSNIKNNASNYGMFES